jgi:hypothetical protein
VSGVNNSNTKLPQPVGSIKLGDVTSGGSDKLTVDNHRTARIIGATIGAGLLGVGGALALLSMGRLKLTPPGAFLATLGKNVPKAGMIAAGAGALLATGSLIGFRPRGMAYDQVIEGSLEQATQAADKRKGDVGIVKAGGGDNRWGLIDMSGDDVVDAQGADAVSVKARLAAVVSRDGDAWVRGADGFVDAGAARTIDVTKIDPNNGDSVKTLVGAQLGATDEGKALTLGEALLDGKPSTDRAEATGKLFEAGVDRAVLVDTPGGVLAFAAAGDGKDADPAKLHARGSQLTPFGSAALLTDISHKPKVSTPTSVREPLGAGDQARPGVDLAAVRIGDLPGLEGRRVSIAGSDVRHLGRPVATFPDVNAAIHNAAGRQDRMLVVQLADGAAVFPLQGETADDLTTALQPPAQLHVVRGRKQYSVGDSGNVTFQQRSVAFNRDEPIGSRIQLGDVNAKVTNHVRSFATQREAIDFVRGNLDDTRTYSIVKADGPDGAFHVYAMDKNAQGGANWDAELGPVAGGAWRNDDVRATVTETENHPSTWGTDVHYFDHNTSRTVRYLAEDGRITETATTAPREISRPLNHIDRAYDPNEANGHHIEVGGKHMHVDRYLASVDSLDEAQRRIDRSANDGSEFVVLDKPNNRGRYHVYSAREGSDGPDWDHSRATPTLASWVEDESRSYGESDDRPGQYGTDVYHYNVTERWRERHISEQGHGSRITDTTGHSRDRDLSYIDRADPPPPPPAPSSPSGGYGGSHSGGSSGGSSGGYSNSPDSYTPDFRETAAVVTFRWLGRYPKGPISVGVPQLTRGRGRPGSSLGRVHAT